MLRRRSQILVALLASGVAASGLGEADETAVAAPEGFVLDSDAAAGKALFLKKCATCHGSRRRSATGEQEHYFTVKLKQATITDIKTYMPNCLDPANKSFTHMEDVSLSYKEIEWTHQVAGTSGSDSWDG